MTNQTMEISNKPHKTLQTTQSSTNNIMQHTKIIECFGIDSYDFVFYLSRIFVKLDKTVLVVDFRDKLKHKWGSDSFENLFTYMDVDFCVNLSQADLSVYDLILMVHNCHERLNIFENSIRLVFTDQLLDNLKFTSNVIEAEKEMLSEKYKTAVIIRNYIDCNVNYKYLRHYFGDNVELFAVAFDYRNLRYCIELWLTDVLRFGRISKDYKDVLREIVYLCADEDSRLIKKAFALAERGK